MLELPNELIKNEKAKRFVERFISDIILECALSIREVFEDVQEDEPEYTLADEIKDLFPPSVAYEKRVEYFEMFESILKDDRELKVGILFEYALNAIITRYTTDDKEIYCFKPTPNPNTLFNGKYLNIKYMEPSSRKYVIKALEKEYEKSDIKNIMEMIEDMRLYKESCFSDHDFELLDIMSKEELAESILNDYLGIAIKK